MFPVGADCRSPLTEHGCHDDSMDPLRIDSWWASRAGANVALACGAKSGVFALDIDRAASSNDWDTMVAPLIYRDAKALLPPLIGPEASTTDAALRAIGEAFVAATAERDRIAAKFNARCVASYDEVQRLGGSGKIGGDAVVAIENRHGVYEDDVNLEPVDWRLDHIQQAIRSIRATTIEGLRVKASVVAYCRPESDDRPDIDDLLVDLGQGVPPEGQSPLFVLAALHPNGGAVAARAVKAGFPVEDLVAISFRGDEDPEQYPVLFFDAHNDGRHSVAPGYVARCTWVSDRAPHDELVELAHQIEGHEAELSALCDRHGSSDAEVDEFADAGTPLYEAMLQLRAIDMEGLRAKARALAADFNGAKIDIGEDRARPSRDAKLIYSILSDLVGPDAVAWTPGDRGADEPRVAAA